MYANVMLYVTGVPVWRKNIILIEQELETNLQNHCDI